MRPVKISRLLYMVPLLLVPLAGPAQEPSENTAGASGHGETPMGEFLGAKITTHPAWFKESFLEFEEDIDEAAAEGRRLMLYFHQDGCPYCNKLVEHNFSNEVMGGQVRRHFDVVAINMWGDREVVQVGGRQFTEKTLAAALDVDFTPTLLFFGENRRVVLRLDGYLPPDEFGLALEYVANRLESSESWVDYLTERRRGTTGNIANAMDRAMPPPYDLATAGRERPLAVLFEEPGCVNCDLLHDRTFRDPDAGPLLDRFDVLQVNRWADTPVRLPDGTSTTAARWARELGIGYSPAMVLFEPGGRVIMKINAQFRTFHVLGALAYASSGAYREEPSFQRYLSARAEEIREQGIDVDIWKY